MPLHSWIVPALLLEIVLVLFAPPIAAGARSLFLSDLAFLLWVPIAAIQLGMRLPREEKKRFALQLGLSAVLVLGVFLHGALRPSLAQPMSQILNAPPDDTFQFFRELVIAIRFVSWIWAALLVTRLALVFTREQLDRAVTLSQQVLAGCVLAAVIALLAVKAHPPLAATLGGIYGYDPTVENWADRIFGTFRSPIEGSLTLGLSLFLLWKGAWAPRSIRVGIAAAALLGIFLTKSITSVMAAGIVLAIVTGLRLERRYRLGWALRYALPGTAISGTAALFWWGSDHPFIAQKLINLAYRVKPWSIFWDAAVSRWDYFLLGQGFGPHFTDNSFVFLFSRGGLLLLAPAVYLLVRAFRRQDVRPEAKVTLLYLVVTSLTVDSLILRPIVAIWIAVGLLRFSFRPS